jgi:hypothetical protein
VFPRTVVEALRSCGYLPHRYDGGPIELRNRPRTPSRGTIRRWCACGSRPPPEPMLRGDQSDHIGRCAK